MDGAPSVSSSIREIRNHHALADVKMAVETAIVIIKNILDKPQDPKLYRIKRGNPSFHRNVGRLEGGLLLMRAIGFVAMGTESGEMGSVLVLRPLGDKSFDATKDFASSHGKTKMGTSTFKFPSLDPETERFLWRRKADLDIAIRMLDKSYDDKTKKSATKDNTTTSTRVSKGLQPTATPKFESTGGKLGESVNMKPLIGGISSFTKGATAAQKAQVQMIKEVFKLMDADRDGLISVSDVKAYFRAIGRNASDMVARKWIRERDLDQDGSVSLVELVASYSHVLDPSSKPERKGIGEDVTVDEVNPVVIAFGLLRLGASIPEANIAVNAACEYIQRILDTPNVASFWRISLMEKDYEKRIGRLFGGHKLMLALGFAMEDNGATLALRDEAGKAWSIVPSDVRKALKHRMEELNKQASTLVEPSVSNVAAVSTAVKLLGDDQTAIDRWIHCIETIHVIVTNVVKNPGIAKFYRINMGNENFHRRVSRVTGGIDMLVSLGFREEEDGSLVLPIDTSLLEITARRLELEVGLNALRKRAASMKKTRSSSKQPVGKEEANVQSKSPVKEKKTALPPKSPHVDQEKEKKKSKEDTGPENTENMSEMGVEQIKQYEASIAKKEKTLRDEKERRLQAEVALNQKTDLVKELQQQLFDMHEKKAKEMDFRQSLTLARMNLDNDNHNKKDSKKLEGGNKLNADTKTKSSKLASKTKDEHEQKHGDGHSGKTTTKKATKVGDKKILVHNQDSFKKGMKIIIGQGVSTEVRTFLEVGSIIVDQPLLYAHPIGSVVITFPHTVKGIEHMNKYLAHEICYGLLVDNIIEEAMSLGERSNTIKALDIIYRDRPFMRHMYYIDVKDPYTFPVRILIVSVPRLIVLISLLLTMARWG